MLHINTPICARIAIPKDRLGVFTNYPSVIKDQALQETILGCSQPVDVTIQDTIAHHNVIKGYLSKVGLEGVVHTT